MIHLAEKSMLRNSSNSNGSQLKMLLMKLQDFDAQGKLVISKLDYDSK